MFRVQADVSRNGPDSTIELLARLGSGPQVNVGGPIDINAIGTLTCRMNFGPCEVKGAGDLADLRGDFYTSGTTVANVTIQQLGLSLTWLGSNLPAERATSKA